MPGYVPLDPEALGRLRRLVQAMHGCDPRALPVEKLVTLARDVNLQAGVTIDFRASRELGQPMVVLRVPEDRAPANCLHNLSPRERDIAALIADGLSNKEIARRLHRSLATVKDHVHRMLTKTGLANRAAIASAMRGHVPSRSSASKSPA